MIYRYADVRRALHAVILVWSWISPTFLIDVTQRNVLEVVFSRAEYWKCVSIGFVMPLGHYLYRQRLEQAVVLSSTIEGQYQPEDYN